MTETVDGFESQNRTWPTPAVPSLNAGGCFSYVANRFDASANRGSVGGELRQELDDVLLVVEVGE